MTYQVATHEELIYVICNQKMALLSRKACSKLGLLTCHVQEATTASKQLS